MPELATEVDCLVVSPELSFASMADRVDGGSKAIRPVPPPRRRRVHVSLAAGDACVDLRGDGHPPAPLREAKPDSGPDQLFALGWRALRAASAIESFRKGGPFRQWVRAIAKDHEVVPDLGAHGS
jgi:hypothetical protein